MQRCRSGGHIVQTEKTVETLSIENEHLNGIITVLNLKVKKTEDLEKELATIRVALKDNEKAREDLREQIRQYSVTLTEQKTKNERFQTLIIEENENLKSIIIEKD